MRDIIPQPDNNFRPSLPAAIAVALAPFARELGREAYNQFVEEVAAEALGDARNFGANIARIVTNTARRVGGEAGQHLTQVIPAIRDGLENAINTYNRQEQEYTTTYLGEANQELQEYLAELRANRPTRFDNGPLTEDQPTTLDELIPENSQDNTSGSMQDATNEPTTEPPAPTAMAARASSGGLANNQVAKETPISNFPSLTYGLQNTHTTILPWVGWFGMVVPKPTSEATYVPVQLRIRMNSIWDMINTSMATKPAAGSAFANTGLYEVPIGWNGTYLTSQIFSKQYAGSTTEKPAWRDYWAEIYQYYTVLGCEWEVIVQGAKKDDDTDNNDLLCAIQYDSYTDTETSTQNIMPLANLAEVLTFENIRWEKVEKHVDRQQERYAKFTGRYKPGMIKHNIVNDGDVKTWTVTIAPLQPKPPEKQQLLNQI